MGFRNYAPWKQGGRAGAGSALPANSALMKARITKFLWKVVWLKISIACNFGDSRSMSSREKINLSILFVKNACLRLFTCRRQTIIHRNGYKKTAQWPWNCLSQYFPQIWPQGFLRRLWGFHAIFKAVFRILSRSDAIKLNNFINKLHISLTCVASPQKRFRDTQNNQLEIIKAELSRFGRDRAGEKNRKSTAVGKSQAARETRTTDLFITRQPS